ncbi:Uncharacterized protein SHERM_26061 [Striga hermonthica]|uniref:Erythronate-4-phosphate dehydrogenase family protein n=1 Tax=Striga hermonthica TaxID=68872 RepID=A0A9N7RI04_STRHE|nr:Uncharacterized protein SHERM_26061 [Striga hermonthica]
MNGRDDELQLAIYRPPPSFTGGCLEIRLFYVRIAPCAVDGLPDQLKLRHLRRELGVHLEVNGARIPPSDAVCINLRRDRVDKDSSEVTYVSTDSVRVSGPMEFEVCEEGDAGCCSGAPVILMKTVLVSPRRKVRHGVTLDAIPEDEEIGKEQMNLCNGVVRQRKLQLMPADMDEYDSDGKVSYGNYSEEMYPGEDGQLTWFNAGVRVGVGIGLGMCLGVGIGVGLLMRSYQATTRSFRRRFF